MTAPGTQSGHLRSSYTENAEFWVKIMRDGLDPYRTQLTNDAVIGAVEPRPGLDILDIGCGEGYLSRLIARHGAHVTGIDACDELIEAARHAADNEGLDIELLTAPADLLPLPDESVDVVVCNHLLNDLGDLEGPMHEFARVLRTNGRLVVLMLHPCFYQPRRDRTTNNTPITVTEYFTERTVEQNFNVAGLISPAPVTVHIRSLETVATALTNARFAITSLAEPHPSPEQTASNPWWQANFTRPMFMLFTATRIGSTQR
jgi:ubiquinone/menaquinone biosynthesis C-methylase UbiE